MQQLLRFNAFIERNMAFVTPTCLVVGILCASWLQNASALVPWLFAFMTFQGSLGSDFGDIRRVASHPLPLIAVMLILHLVMPLVALAAGLTFFGNNMNLVTGIVLEFLVPTGIVSLTWVGIYQGNQSLALSIIVLDTLVSPFLVPFMLNLLLGSSVEMSPWGMMQQLVFMIAIPALCAISLNQYTKGRVAKTLKPNLAPFAKLALIGVVTINSTRIASFVKNLNAQLILTALCILLLAITGYLIAWAVSRLIHQNPENTVTVLYNSGLRNISAGAVIAAQYFPAEVMFPVMIGTLFQQVLAALVGTLITSRSARMNEITESR
ncbi:MAG: bile acid:sodium symporter family protein [Eubacteriaceae bacterium]|jgi:BASS family bile acid:Na+ symporter